MSKVQVSIIGSGSFGTAIARRLALNALEHVNKGTTSVIDPTIKMWVNHELVDGRPLVDILNEDHDNVRYLPGVKLPHNIAASSDLQSVCESADILFFVIPHQFLGGVLKQAKPFIKAGARGVSLIKGVEFTAEGPERLSTFIQKELPLQSFGVLMGANVAGDVAEDHFVEATVASPDASLCQLLEAMFKSNCFRVQTCGDVATVEYCGALKNVVALGAGICDAFNLGQSTKGALLRQGLQEMATFCKMFDENNQYQLQTMLTSSGVADLIATSYGGRNRRCAELFAIRREKMTDLGGAPERLSVSEVEKMWDDIEREALAGQMLQGVGTCRVLLPCIAARLSEEELKATFPLFHRIHSIVVLGESPKNLFPWD